MNMVDKDYWFSKNLKTPLGFGIALILSFGVGFGLSELSFRGKAQKRRSLYKKRVKDIQKVLNEEPDFKTYSLNLVKMVYETVPLAIQEDYNQVYREFIAKRRNSVDNFEEYINVTNNYTQNTIEVMNKGLRLIITDAGGSFAILQQSRTKWARQGQEMTDVIMDLFRRIEVEVPRKPNTRKITKELLKQIYEYKLQIMFDFKSDKIRNGLEAVVMKIWLRDKVFIKFGVDMETQKFMNLQKTLSLTDLEINVLKKQISEKLGLPLD